MKQTIISKCFSKMKRIMLTLFAALCVGSVWGGYLTFDAENLSISEDGTITFNARLGYIGTTTERYAKLTAKGYHANGDVAFETAVIGAESNTELQLVGNDYVSQLCTVASSGLSASEDYKIEFHFWAVKADGATSADYDITQVVSPPVGIGRVKVTYGDYRFRIAGIIESGYDVSAVKVNYILGTGEPNTVVEATIDPEAQEFYCEIPYAKSDYTLTYSILVEYGDGTLKNYINNENSTFTKTRLRADNTKLIYTWTGAGDGTSWTDELNWSVNSESDVVGYPGTHDGSYYRTMISISESVDCIDLGGQTYGFVDDGGMFIGNNISVKFKNGTLKFTNGKISRTSAGAASGLIGANGTTLIFESVKLVLCKGDGTDSGNLDFTPRTGATIIFEGDISDKWDYFPKSGSYSNTKMIVRNGTLTLSRAFDSTSGSNGSQNDVLISNGKWKINNSSARTITPFKSLSFRDGPDRQAQFECTGNIVFAGVYDFALQATPYSTAYYTVPNLSNTTAGSIKVDVSDYKDSSLVPLVKFTGSLSSNTKTVMNTLVNTGSKLVVMANGEDVKTARNARLVWNESVKTLYFQQDSQYAAEVAGVKYDTLAEAFAAAGDGATVKLLNDAELAEKVTIKTALTLDLNGCTLSETVTPAADEFDYGAFYIGTAGNLTITDSATGGKIATNGDLVIGNYGTVTVNGGTIEAGDDADNDASIYNFYYNGSTYGKATINGGSIGRIWNCGTANITVGTVGDIDNSGAMTIAFAATVSGTVIIKNGSDAAEVPGAGTLTAPESLTVQVGNEGADAFYVDGKWLVQVVVATIGEAKFASLDAAIAAAGAEDEVVVVADIATDAAFEITKKVTINLNGKTIATTQADTEGNGVFWVNAGGELTLNGEGTVNGVGGNAYNIAIWADGGKVIINGGTYTNEGAQDDGPDGAHFDLIYVKNSGAVEINGGTFKCQTPEWTLNSHDTKKGTIVVNGGLFYQFNPSDCATEGAGTNWCAEGLKGAESVENAGYYEIVDAWTAPMPEKDGEADITEEYAPDVLAALEAAVATSVDVNVNGIELKGNEAVKALNAAVKCFDGALTFDGTAASVDIVIEVTEVNVEDPAASTVVVKRGTEELTVKVTPTVKYFYPETKTWGTDKPESGAVLFKLVFEAK